MVVAILKKTLTYKLILERGEFVMSAPTAKMMEVVVFAGEVPATHVRKGAMEGELYREESDPLLYMGTKYDPSRKSLGKFYARLAGIERADYDSPLLKKYLTTKKRR